jgi:hypothetical protein
MSRELSDILPKNANKVTFELNYREVSEREVSPPHRFCPLASCGQFKIRLVPFITKKNYHILTKALA